MVGFLIYTSPYISNFSQLSWNIFIVEVGGSKVEDMFTLFGKLKVFPMMCWGAVVEELALNLRPKAEAIHSQAEYL